MLQTESEQARKTIPEDSWWSQVPREGRVLYAPGADTYIDLTDPMHMELVVKKALVRVKTADLSGEPPRPADLALVGAFEYGRRRERSHGDQGRRIEALAAEVRALEKRHLVYRSLEELIRAAVDRAVSPAQHGFAEVLPGTLAEGPARWRRFMKALWP